MRAYHNDPALKERVMAKIAAHREADRIAKGAYVRRSNGKKKHCAVGCLLEDSNGGHMRYESEFGIPVQLAWLEDGIFESLPDEHAISWPERFMGAISVGADLGNVWPQMAIWLMVDKEWGIAHTTDDAEIQALCHRVADGYQRVADGNPLSVQDAEALARAARDVWDARAAWAVWAAWAARAVWAAWAARAARDARAAWDAWDARAARAVFSLASSDKLIELLEAA
jgi:uncharacterized protein YdbL (DUF1318 family)